MEPEYVAKKWGEDPFRMLPRVLSLDTFHPSISTGNHGVRQIRQINYILVS